MGVIKKEIVECFCDVCQKPCSQDDSKVSVRVNTGDGRDVGPATINGRLSFYQPYGCADGIVCRECKIRWLKTYIQREESTHA